MPVQPTVGDTSWGAAQNAFTGTSLDAATGNIKNEALQVASTAPIADAALANKKYVDDGGEKEINGTPTQVFTKYFTGTLVAGASTSVNHGITGIDNILHVSVLCYDDVSAVYRSYDNLASADSSKAFKVATTGGQVIISSVGGDIQGNKYRIKLDYIL